MTVDIMNMCTAKLRIIYQGAPDPLADEILLNKVRFLMEDIVEAAGFEYDQVSDERSMVVKLTQYLDEEDLETAAGYFENDTRGFQISYERFDITLN